MDSEKTLASLLGADAFAAIRHESTSKHLTAILDQQAQVTFSDKTEHQDYLQFRQQLAQSVTLAAIAGDSRLDNYVHQWNELQKQYAHNVIKGVSRGLAEQQEFLETCDQDLIKGEPVRQKHNLFRNKNPVELSFAEIEELVNLKKEIERLDETAKERERLYRAIAGVSRVEQTLTTLIQSGNQSIHYLIPSVNEAQQKLGANTYDGPVFEPFLLSNRTEVRDIFMREVVSPHKVPLEPKTTLRVAEIPPILTELVQVYQHIAEQNPGTPISPRQVSETLNLEALGVKGLAGYLDDNPEIFGVQKRDAVGSRSFIRKESGAIVDRNAFLSYMIEGKLQQHDLKEVNDFYFQKTLSLLRETPQAYLGFSKENVHDLAAKHHFPVGKIYISRNLKDIAEVKLKDPASESEGYVFREVIPTPTQVQYAREAVNHFGRSRFAIKDLVTKTRELHPQYNVSPRVTEKVLELNCKDWGLKVVENTPPRYQLENQTTSQAASAAKPSTERLM